MEALLHIVVALTLTLIVECGFSLLFRSRQLTYAVLLRNLLTNPLLNLLLLLYATIIGQEFYLVVLGALEVLVVFVEAPVIWLMTGFRLPKAFLLSLFFNALSFGVGLLFW